MNEKLLISARKLTADFLRNRRRELGLTQEELAEKSELGIATIKRAESAKFFLNTKQLWMLCNALDLYFFMEEKEKDSDVIYF